MPSTRVFPRQTPMAMQGSRTRVLLGGQAGPLRGGAFHPALPNCEEETGALELIPGISNWMHPQRILLSFGQCYSSFLLPLLSRVLWHSVSSTHRVAVAGNGPCKGSEEVPGPPTANAEWPYSAFAFCRRISWSGMKTTPAIWEGQLIPSWTGLWALGTEGGRRTPGTPKPLLSQPLPWIRGGGLGHCRPLSPFEHLCRKRPWRLVSHYHPSCPIDKGRH
nr:uncharacterized protein LOC118967447 [Manis javanica]